MIPVEIRFPAPFNRTKVIRRQVPQAWNELSAEQLCEVADALYSITDTHTLNLHLLRALLCLPWGRLLALSPEHVVALGHLTGFLLTGNGLTRNLLPVLKPSIFPWWTAKESLYGPGDGFRNLRFSEFVVADSHYMRLQQQPGEEYLDKLIAALYRPAVKGLTPASPEYDGDLREKFNQFQVDGRLPAVHRLPRKTKLAILTWYAGCRQALVAQYKNLFSGDSENASARHPWLQMLTHVPNDKFGTIDHIHDQRVHTVFYHMDQLMEEAEQQREKLESQSSTR